MRGPYGYYVQLGPTVEGQRPNLGALRGPRTFRSQPQSWPRRSRCCRCRAAWAIIPRRASTVEASVGPFRTLREARWSVQVRCPRARACTTSRSHRAVELLAAPKTARSRGRQATGPAPDRPKAGGVDGAGVMVLTSSMETSTPPCLGRGVATLTLDEPSTCSQRRQPRNWRKLAVPQHGQSRTTASAHRRTAAWRRRKHGPKPAPGKVPTHRENAGRESGAASRGGAKQNNDRPVLRATPLATVAAGQQHPGAPAARRRPV